MTTPDVTIRGGGIFGLAVAWAAAKRGAKVRLIETKAIGAGSSGGLVGALSPHVPEQWNDKKAFQFDSLAMGEAWWAEVADASGLPTGYARLGRYQPLADDRAVEHACSRAEEAKTLWQGRFRWEVVPAEGEFVPQSPTGLMIHDTLTARIHPRMGTAALVEAIRARGGEVIIGDAEEAGPVVWATGVAGLQALSEDLGKPVGSGVKGQAMIVGLDARDRPQVFATGLLIVPHGDGTTAVGSTAENEWTSPDTTDEQLDAVRARAVALCPWLADAPVLTRWAGLRPRARSLAPMLGEWPGRPGHYVANGGFKIGFGMAPKVGEVMAALVLEGRDEIPEGFRVEASLKKRIKSEE
ncbi:FAD-binding oxidoreductase [Rhodobacter sp. CZR27]|uniref:NAD(P)/FAD-dependent oxidoreductase n=1 Tax=Rhodobacter sp. CZR27 TaxID=2033869 RepID=UPI000BBE9A55|nr:FAD-dependent oxidoreductase [Rhodobacter sp. CZR27]